MYVSYYLQAGPSGSASVPLDLKKEEVKDPVVPKGTDAIIINISEGARYKLIEELAH